MALSTSHPRRNVYMHGLVVGQSLLADKGDPILFAERVVCHLGSKSLQPIAAIAVFKELLLGEQFEGAVALFPAEHAREQAFASHGHRDGLNQFFSVDLLVEPQDDGHIQGYRA